jgi:AcrR family transcriptional regulator
MATLSQGANTPSQDGSRGVDRANRILDAAAALILRWGYNKTTVDDISRQSGVAKGTIYLHWKTREDLFSALIFRENVEFLVDFERSTTENPSGATLRSVIEHVALAIMKRPLLMAVLLRDLDVLGRLARSEQGNTVGVEKLTAFKAYLEFLRERHLVRTDISLEQQMYMLSAVFMGFFLVEPLMPDEFRLSDEERADLMAETVHRALGSGHPASPEELRAVSTVFSQYLKRYTAVAREQFQREMEPVASRERTRTGSERDNIPKDRE